MQKKIISQAVGVVVAVAASGSVWATNGMNLEGYGAVSTAMGGASAAFDNGNSGVMNNPATLSLMEANTAQFGVGIRMLGPDVNSSVPSMGISSKSDGDAYYMPSLSYVRKTDNLVYGAAVLAQGGMGTEYGRNSQLFSGGQSMMGNATALSGEEIRSELSVGRLMFPLSYSLSDRLDVGGSFEVSWAAMDLQMDVDGNYFGNLVANQAATGTMVQGLGLMMQGGMVTDVNWARFDFTDDKDYTGEAKGWGVAGKFGATYKVNDQFRLGAAFHTKTAMDDLSSDGATMSMSVVTPMGAMKQDVTGEIKLRNFEWPATALVGGAFQVNDQLMLAADVKWIGWSDVMDAFRMSFKADNTAANGSFAGSSMDVTMDQKWDDQTVFQVGAAYKANEKLTLRGGFSLSDNPIPSSFMNPLFPAIIEDHYSVGFSYGFDQNNSVAGSLTYAPEVEQTNTAGVRVTHSQTNWQLNYTYTFR